MEGKCKLGEDLARGLLFVFHVYDFSDPTSIAELSRHTSASSEAGLYSRETSI